MGVSALRRLRALGLWLLIIPVLGCCTGNPHAGSAETAATSAPPTAAQATDTTPPTAAQATDSDAQPQSDAFSLRAVGRAIEARDATLARSLLAGHADDSAQTRFLASRLAMLEGDTDARIDWLSRTSFAEPAHEVMRRVELLERLVAADAERCLAEVDAFFAADLSPTRYRQRELHKVRAQCHESLNQHAEAARSYAEAARRADGRIADQLKVRQALALSNAGDVAAAVALLRPLSQSGASAAVMEDARRALVKHKAAPVLDTDAKLARIDRLIAHKGYDAAQQMITALTPGLRGKARHELLWRHARMLFQRRGHYPQAIAKADEVIRSGGPHADEARRLRAQALSRLDRDEEAIQAYQALARRNISPSLRGNALLSAARLMYYHGQHRAARAQFNALLGTAKAKPARPVALTGDQQREAHFLGGLCALLDGDPKAARTHFQQASRGTSDGEVLARNRYWAAVALLETQRDAGAAELASICETDATEWYALLAGHKRAEVGLSPAPCLWLPPHASGDTADADTAKITDADTAKIADADTAKTTDADASPLVASVPLADLSPHADFWAQMGLYREASRALRDAEDDRATRSDTQDWIIHYTALDAPQHAIRRASIGLQWANRDDAPWRAHSAYPRPYQALVQRETARHDMPANLVYAIARKESLFDPHAVSSVGAMGMMQMMPATWETNRRRAGLPELPPGALPGPEDSIIAGAFELAHLLTTFQGALPLAIMGYNAGPAAVHRWLDRSGDLPTDLFVEKASFVQTRNYVRRVYQNLVRYAQLYGDPLPVLPTRIARLSPRRTTPASPAAPAGQ